MVKTVRFAVLCNAMERQRLGCGGAAWSGNRKRFRSGQGPRWGLRRRAARRTLRALCIPDVMAAAFRIPALLPTPTGRSGAAAVARGADSGSAGILGTVDAQAGLLALVVLVLLVLVLLP